jgi:hypothetical protein
MAQPRTGLTSLFLGTAGFCCAFHSTTATAVSVRLVACANREALKACPEHNILSAVDALERTWVACMFSRELVRIDPGSGVDGERIELSSGPLRVIAHPDQLVLSASTPRLNQVQEIALDSRQVTRSFEVGKIDFQVDVFITEAELWGDGFDADLVMET